MKILILEDDEEKMNAVSEQVTSAIPGAHIDRANNFRDYLRHISTNEYNFLIVDLVVPSQKLAPPADMTEDIIEVTRGDYKSKNFKTPVVALTGYDEKAEEGFRNLNQNDITVITYDVDTGNWKNSIRNKVISCKPRAQYVFVVICALPKEADAFAEAGYQVGERMPIGGLSCREFKIGNRIGVIVTAPRMGLVSAAVTCSRAIDLFSPKIVCMSGICAGIKGRANIYDVIISNACHQNDSGKWAGGKFESEIYSVQMDHQLNLQLDTLISRKTFISKIAADISLTRKEFPEGLDELKFNVFLAPTSSGSAVVADDTMVEVIGSQQRKLSGFEMESFAIYEAARLSLSTPKVFSAKSVVDDGSPSKGDAFHRVACLLSAKVVYECLSSGIMD